MSNVSERSRAKPWFRYVDPDELLSGDSFRNEPVAKFERVEDAEWAERVFVAYDAFKKAAELLVTAADETQSILKKNGIACPTSSLAVEMAQTALTNFSGRMRFEHPPAGEWR